MIPETAQQASSTTNLRRLFALRNIAIAGQTLTVLGVHYGLGLGLPLLPLCFLISAQALLNLLTWWRLQGAPSVTERELFVQLLLDVSALTALLYFTGGSTNPFVLLYLLPLTLTAAALPWVYAWAMVGVTVACYTLLMFAYVPLPHGYGMHGSDFDLHVMGMWLGFVLSAGLIAYFAVRMASTLRERDHVLATMREKELRNERIVALGTLAAGAAHELGTPLSTMAVVVNELAHEAGDAPARAAPLQILKEQIGRCKAILSTLTASAGPMRAESGRCLTLDGYLGEIIEQWRAMRPTVSAKTHWQGPRPVLQIVAEHTLSQAIINILNNAADASPESVEIQGRWDAQQLELEICDRGPGLTPMAVEQAGEPFFSTKGPDEGLGLGLFLAHATIQRFGGMVRLSNREGGGACAHLVLPLTNLVVTT